MPKAPTRRRAQDLAPSPRNPRLVSPDALAALERSMDKYGDLSGIVWNRRSGHLIAGHQRLKHFDPAADVTITERYRRANAQGTTAVGYVTRKGERWSYREVDVDEQTELEMNLRANIPAGEMDKKALSAIVTGLRGQGADLPTLGLTAEMVAALLGRGEASPVSEPPVLEAPAKPKSARGQLYLLGAHRLLCDDSTDRGAVKLALGTAFGQVACVFTDPPYGVDYQGGRPIANDKLKRDALATFLTRALAAALAAARDDAAFYIWHATETRRDFDTAVTAVGLQEHQQIIWVKSGLVLGRADYQWAHEPCIYAAKAGHAAAFHGDRQQATVWRFAATSPGGLTVVVGPGLLLSDGRGAQLFLVQQAPKGRKVRHLRVDTDEPLRLTASAETDTVWEVSREHKAQHPTQKPVALAHRAIINSTRPGEWVYDAFGGSGNTLLAAELTGRKAALVEIDPAYCDVIRQRYADLVEDPQWSPIGKLMPRRAAAKKKAKA